MPRTTLTWLLLIAPVAGAQLADLQPGRNFDLGLAEFGTGARSENIDVGDVDGDGDLDVIVANGGDGNTPQANRIYINLGGAQAGVQGTFADETATRFVGIPDDTSRDCDFVDVDGDGDLDIHISNTGWVTTGGEPSRIYANQGGLQGGSVGYFVEGSNAAFGQLVSVPPADQVLGGDAGPFRDYSCDCDFADLDDDGDLDMFHSSYGPNISGTRDARVFLNDGRGVFDELWPWADPAADTKTHSLDIDLADLDGDLDIDVFASSRDSQARVYANNLHQPLSGSPFQDVTGTALIATGATLQGGSNYEVELGDVDGDGDFDAWMVNYGGGSNWPDRLLRNVSVPGSGRPAFLADAGALAGDPSVDETEVDFFDYDGDGDLDAFLANFSGTNYLYESGLAQGFGEGSALFHRTGSTSGGSQAPWPELPTTGNGQTSYDGEAADMDGDGDDDLLIANHINGQNRYFPNILGIPDSHAPSFAQVSEVPDGPVGPDVVVHAQVRDNHAFYVIDFFDTRLVYAVDGGTEVQVPMTSQGGQQFRGTIPGALVGTIGYRVESTDLNGNTGVSATHVFVQGPSAWSDLGFALPGADGPPVLAGSGTLAPGSPGTLSLVNAAPLASDLLIIALGSAPVPFKGGTLAAFPFVATLPLLTNVSGGIPLAWGAWPAGLAPGTTLVFQHALADAGAVQGVALSNALQAVTP